MNIAFVLIHGNYVYFVDETVSVGVCSGLALQSGNSILILLRVGYIPDEHLQFIDLSYFFVHNEKSENGFQVISFYIVKQIHLMQI